MSRVMITMLQCYTNFVIPDHDADAFKSPRAHKTMSISEELITFFLGGFRRWDAEYFLHIAEHGYTYENTLVFYPLYSYVVWLATVCVSAFMPFECSFRELSLFVAVALNIVFFALAAKALFDLTTSLWPNERLAHTVVALFCINPASIFFSAPYSECLFSWLSFKVMLNSANHRFWRAMLWLVFCIWCRSNGIINFGFVIYYMLTLAMKSRSKYLCIVYYIPRAIASAVVVFVAFAVVQIYYNFLFCMGYQQHMSEHIRDYGNVMELNARGQKDSRRIVWCQFRIPYSYAYLQSEYWNVGFLNYYELKQIPNFLLAAPIITFILFDSFRFARRTISFRPIGINWAFWKENEWRFVYIAHAFFLCVFCIFYVHIQVTTRMLASSSPVLYWICAQYFYKEGSQSLSAVLTSPKSVMTKFIRTWFLSYNLIGTTLFSNFFPWT